LSTSTYGEQPSAERVSFRLARYNAPTSVLEEGQSAIAIWSTLPTRYAFDWMCCLPMLAVAVEQPDLAKAERWAQAMLSSA
jgi:hypothetical protein